MKETGDEFATRVVRRAPSARVDEAEAAVAPRIRRQSRSVAAAGEANLADDADDSAEGEAHEYRRRSKPVRVRRNRWRDLMTGMRQRRGLVASLALLLVLALALDAFLFHSPRFELAGSSQIEVTGGRQVSAAQVAPVFASDLGRNLFFIPLEARRLEVERIAWVQSAEVMRVWPNRVQVRLHERKPVAFARATAQLRLVDAQGVLLESPARGDFDFPVLTGLADSENSDANTASAVEARAEQMQRYLAWRDGVDSDGGHPSNAFSEINVHDPLDLQATVVPQGASSALLIHFGDRDFAARYRIYRDHIAQWQHDFARLPAVDLRYDGQAVVDPGDPPAPAAGSAGSTPPAAPLSNARNSTAAARRAGSGGHN